MIGGSDILESLFKWMHVVAGILWIGLLYFFNWVNSQFAPTLDAESKKKVLPELLPRTLYWFRWGAAWTWVTGVVLLTLVFYHSRTVFENPVKPHWGIGGVLILFVFFSVFLYDILYKTVLTNPTAGFWGGWVLASLVPVLLMKVGHFSYRGTAIHLGAMFGTFMAFNVWYRIWPAQKKVINAIKNGEAPDPAAAGLAGLRSKHNTYMSVPLVFLMLNSHSTWAASNTLVYLPLVVLFGWSVVWMLYKRSTKVKEGHPGFLPAA